MATELAKIRPYRKATAVTPHDTNALAGGVTQALWIGGAGVIVARFADAAADTSLTVPAGTELRAGVTHVRSTGTTATLIIALY